ncbi:Xaa-Pro dipeptidase [Natronospira bacteriovora]|uniref:Amidohydrolase family protein n=1 Tax=Natronospira bacteriovora TaxID=3069753 RepID=A0ABU0W8M4_9GAMM|nr:amidohydrolase family protein [Natronospira sp. AB-CW4]MDQ2070307.1 amidohydrolase family protein [Natronospira sp. AB-CW4]
MSRLPVVVTTLFLLFSALPACAESDRAQGDAEAAEHFIHAGHMLDTATGSVLDDQLIGIANGRVVSVAPRGDSRVPEGVRVIDLADHFVLPGLTDAHVHLTSDATIQGHTRLGRGSHRAALFGVRAARDTLAAGFTTVRNVGAPNFADLALRDAIEAGDFPGPRMRVAGKSLGMTGGHCDNNLLPPEFGHRSGGVADGPWAVREQVRKNLKYGADTIKFCATGGVMSKGTATGARQYTLEEMQAIVEEAHALGMRVAAHAHGDAGIELAIRAGVDSVEHASLISPASIALAREYGTALVMDVYVSDYILGMGEEIGILEESLEKEREVGQTQRDNLRRAHEAGVRIVFGSDAGVYPHGQNGKQFERMVDAGMTPLETIQAATIHAAELLDWAEDIGRIAPGFHADIIAVSGNPLEDVTKLESVAFVMKGGVEHKVPDAKKLSPANNKNRH